MGRIYDFISNTTDGVLAVDDRQTIVLWNEGASALLGHRSSEVFGKRCHEVMRGRDAEGCVVCRPECEVISAARRFDLPPTHRIAVDTKRGHQVWLDVSTIVVPSNERESAALIHLFREVTRQHELLRVTRDFAEEVSELTSRSRSARLRCRQGPGSSVDLTRREHEVLTQLTMGASTQLIADRLSISERTARNHVNNLLLKLGVHSRLEAVTLSMRNRLV